MSAGLCVSPRTREREEDNMTARSRLALLWGLCVAGVAAASASFPIQAIVIDGDDVPGVGLVTRVDEVVVNSVGQWHVEADTDFANGDEDTVLLTGFQYAPFGLLLREGQALPQPAGALLDGFDTINLNDVGSYGGNYFLSNTGSLNNDSGVYFSGSLVIQEGSSSTAPNLPADSVYKGWFDTRFNNNNQIMQMASMDIPGVGTTVDRALIRIDNPAGAFTELAVVARGDELLPGRFVSDLGTGASEYGFNDPGDVIYFADLDGDTATDGTIWLNDTLLAQEGSPSPVAGRNYQTLSDRSANINNTGDYAFRADLDGDTATDDVIIMNGAPYIQTGMAPPDPALAGFTLTSIGSSGSLELDDAGNLVWYGDWDDPDTDKDTGLFWNDTLILQEGVTMIDGSLVDTINAGEEGFELSTNGEWLIFRATLADGRDGAFLMQIPEPSAILLLAIGVMLGRSRR